MFVYFRDLVLIGGNLHTIIISLNGLVWIELDPTLPSSNPSVDK